MDLLSWGIIGGLVVTFICSVDYIRIHLFRNNNIWIKLGLENYKIINTIEGANETSLIVQVPIGGSFDELVKYKGKIEKAYKCKCQIKDLEKSRNIQIKLEF